MDKDVDHSSKWATSSWTMTLLMMMSCIIIKQPSSSLVNYTLSPCITKCLTRIVAKSTSARSRYRTSHKTFLHCIKNFLCRLVGTATTAT
jgi:hypothetical protein